jgi:hypothetical protein
VSGFEQMREKHRKDSMLTLSFFVFLLLLFLFHEEYTILGQRLFSEPAGVCPCGGTA